MLQELAIIQGRIEAPPCLRVRVREISLAKLESNIERERVVIKHEANLQVTRIEGCCIFLFGRWVFDVKRF